MKFPSLLLLTFPLLTATSLRAESPATGGTPKQRFIDQGWQGGSSAEKSLAARRERYQKAMLEIYDANQDGALDATETARRDKAVAAHSQAFLQTYDLNQDGVLDKKELAAAREKIRRDRAAFYRKYDRNQDEKLDDAEKAEAQKEILRRQKEFRQNYDSIHPASVNDSSTGKSTSN